MDRPNPGTPEPPSSPPPLDPDPGTPPVTVGLTAIHLASHVKNGGPSPGEYLTELGKAILHHVNVFCLRAHRALSVKINDIVQGPESISNQARGVDADGTTQSLSSFLDKLK